MSTSTGTVALVGLLAIVGFCFRRWRWWAVLAFAVVVAMLGGWWSTIRPSNDRDWQPEVTRLPEATIQGDLVTVRNTRNFDYRTETDFTPRYTIERSTGAGWTAWTSWPCTEWGRPSPSCS